MTEAWQKLKGRGAAHNPKSRFETLELTPDPAALEADTPGRPTTFYRDVSKTVLTGNTSPDIGYNVSLNPYRGVRARLRVLLLCETDPRVPGVLDRARFREQDHGQDGCARAAPA